MAVKIFKFIFQIDDEDDDSLPEYQDDDDDSDDDSPPVCSNHVGKTFRMKVIDDFWK